MSERLSPTAGNCARASERLRCEPTAAGKRSARRAGCKPPSADLIAHTIPEEECGSSAETCQNPRVAPYTWTVREGTLDGPLIMREYVYDVPDREPVEGQELYLSNGSGPWRVCLVEQVPEVPRSPYNILVVESVY